MRGFNTLEIMAYTTTIDIGLDTPIHLLTPRQLFEMQREWLAGFPTENNAPTEKRWLVNSAEELAEILGTSRATIYRMKATGALDGCISQYGRWIVFDVNKVLELHKLSHRKKRNKGDGRG